MRTLLMVLFALATMSAGAQSDFYGFKVKTLEGDDFDFASLKGKKVMVVNTASKCGLTPQYELLEALYKKYGPDKFVIVGFPANNFGNQEPGTAEDIKKFCTRNYGVSFVMLEKISVKGDDMHPVYKWLTSKSKNGFEDSQVQWNFQKYLVGPTGKLEKVIPPRTKPDDAEVTAWIEGNNP